MKSLFKTLFLIPIIILIGTVFYGILLGVLFMSYFVRLLMMPTKLYAYIKQLDDYKRIKQ